MVGARGGAGRGAAGRSELLALEAAAAGGLDHENLARGEVGGVAAAHWGDGAVGALDPVAAEGARRAALAAEGGDAPVAAQGGDGHRLEEPDPAGAAVAAVPAGPAPPAPL